MGDPISDGGSAFPWCVADVQGIAANSADFGAPGMSLRDYFAAQALNGLLSAEANPQAMGFPNGQSNAADVFAMHSYQLADAMLQERLKQAVTK